MSMDTEARYSGPSFIPIDDEDVYEGPTQDLEPVSYSDDGYLRQIEEAAARNAAMPSYWQPWQRPSWWAESWWLKRLLGWLASSLVASFYRLIFGAYHLSRLTVWSALVHGTAWVVRGPIRFAIGLVGCGALYLYLTHH